MLALTLAAVSPPETVLMLAGAAFFEAVLLETPFSAEMLRTLDAALLFLSPSTAVSFGVAEAVTASLLPRLTSSVVRASPSIPIVSARYPRAITARAV